MPLRDQQRALHAYNAVATVRSEQQKDYEIAVNDLGANILRSGLCAAIAAVQRLGDRGNILLGHLASAGVPGLEGATAQDLAQRIRKLDTDSYMLATRELLQVATWLKRAVQATFGDD
jgi:CRISPR-associated protein Cmr5